ncbi:hypothetical protein E5C31_19980 [Providencia rettgeri]|uniref:Transmembrane protein n=1 Tax=Alcaligenes parafaecalis TaxID=171260 RepID=A0ABT3VRP0_9BURK|nr:MULTISPECIES: hypothetical protein [Alcaligenes]MBX6962961.1 hypothetical protein [Providencia rettgeri]MBX7029611.1 hypothetical protein [Alcaligenes faecalis]MBY6348247.1 hypothetical protein [Providencia rettgeri]MCX5466035.1 hypothetical protein [Alcaligenes parafaecalis]QFY78877.1 hypothetical protein DUD43_14835 [Alcaligenes faecalis]
MNQPISPELEPGLSLRKITHICYGLFSLAMISAGIFGAAAVAAVILAYVKRGDASGTIYASHLDWVIKTFWWGLLWVVLSALLTTIFIGWVTALVALVWIIHRLIKGWLALAGGQALGHDY